MTSVPLVSIITPAFNMQDYVGMALDSALGQDVANLEVIVIDDGSTDGTAQVLKRYAGKHPNLRAVSTDNHGQGYARNLALGQATGEYVMFLDADDYIEPSFASTLVKAIQEAACDLVVFPYRYFSDSPQEQSEPVLDFFPPVGVYEGDAIACLLQDNAYFACCRAYRRAFLDSNSIRFGEGYIYEDMPFFVAAVLAAQRACVADWPVYCVRSNAASDTRSGHGSSRHADDFVTAVSECVSLIEQNADRPGIDVFRYQFSRYALRKFMRFYYERVPHRLRGRFADSFLDSMGCIGDFGIADSSDRRLDFCVRHNVFWRRRTLMLRAFTLYCKKLRPHTR